MAAVIDLNSWKSIIRLPYYVLYSVGLDQGDLYKRQIENFIVELGVLTSDQWQNLLGQIADDAIKEFESIIIETNNLTPRQLIHTAKAAISISRDKLDAGIYRAYIGALIELFKHTQAVAPFYKNLSKLLKKKPKIMAAEELCTMLEAEILALDRVKA